MRNLHTLHILMMVSVLCPALGFTRLVAQDDVPAGNADAQTGALSLTFMQRSPLSGITPQLNRRRVRAKTPPKDYDLTKESFEAYIPKNYKADGSYGLFVWINAGNSGKCSGQWKAIFDKHKLLFIGANKAGNSRPPLQRFGLALDAVANMSTRYKIDKRRIYVSGISGGGRSSSQLGFLYPEVFAGVFSIVGNDYFRALKLPGTNKVLPPHILPPPAKQLGYMKQNNRYVLLTGEKDFNKGMVKAAYEAGFKADRFKHVRYMEVPGMGHTLPPIEWFEKAIVFMDSALKASGRDPAGTNPVAARKQRIAASQLAIALKKVDRDPRRTYLILKRIVAGFPNTTAAAQAAAHIKRLENDPKIKPLLKKAPAPASSPSPDRAGEWMRLARNYLSADRPDLAGKQLEKIIAQFPKSDEAKDAAKLLKQIEGK